MKAIEKRLDNNCDTVFLSPSFTSFLSSVTSVLSPSYILLRERERERERKSSEPSFVQGLLNVFSLVSPRFDVDVAPFPSYEK